MENLEDLITLRDEAVKAKATNRLKYYDPYEYQLNFHAGGRDHPQRLLMAANRVGKTFCGAAEMAYHLTGLYPEWWEGRRFDKPIKAWAGGVSNDKTRDVCQAELLGDPGNPFALGTGAIPANCLGEQTRKPGVPNAKAAVLVKHISGGWSKLVFKSYEMGHEAWMGEAVHAIWLDEEPPQPIVSQAMTRTVDTAGITFMTFTPENGVTQVVGQFINDPKRGQQLFQATWDDAPHLTPEVQEQILGALPPWERDMRSRGIPLMGSGLVFPIDLEEIMIDAFAIPDYWARICAIDFGWEHPTAVVWMAHDRDTDIVYIYDVYRASNTLPAVVSQAIKARGDWIKVIWPHDGMRGDGRGGITTADQYRKMGVKMHYQKFCNPPAPDEKETSANNSIEPGIQHMLERMMTGRLKVVRTLNDWFEEARMYHRKDGKIVDHADDLMSASRYAIQSLRFAKTLVEPERAQFADSEFDLYGGM